MATTGGVGHSCTTQQGGFHHIAREEHRPRRRGTYVVQRTLCCIVLLPQQYTADLTDRDAHLVASCHEGERKEQRGAACGPVLPRGFAQDQALHPRTCSSQSFFGQLQTPNRSLRLVCQSISGQADAHRGLQAVLTPLEEHWCVLAVRSAGWAHYTRLHHRVSKACSSSPPHGGRLAVWW
jgi:hypothetical protein